jgi:hypothetical protein
MSTQIFYTLPLMEGIVGFGTLGVVLIGLSWLDKKGIITVDEGIITAGLIIGSIAGIGWVLFKSTFLLGI